MNLTDITVIFATNKVNIGKALFKSKVLQISLENINFSSPTVRKIQTACALD